MKNIIISYVLCNPLTIIIREDGELVIPYISKLFNYGAGFIGKSLFQS